MNVSAFDGLAQPADALYEQGAHKVDELKSLGERSPEAAGRRFEELFTTMLVREFRKTLPEGFFGGGVGADTYESWLDEHLGKVLADQDVLGLAGLLKSAQSRSVAADVPAEGGDAPGTDAPPAFPEVSQSKVDEGVQR